MLFVKVGGVFIAYKSENADEELRRANKAIVWLGGKIKEIYLYSIDEEKNSLIVIEKIKRSPNQFPRRGNKPRIAPIL